MKILGLDSSGLVASVAVVEGENLLAEYTVNYKKTHSQTLLPMLDEIARMTELDLNSIDAIAVAGGPGSFTGLRIGSATAKGLGFALGKPLVQVPTVDGLAYNLWGCRDLVCPLMDARRNQTYTGLYDLAGGKMQVVRAQCAVGIDEIIGSVNAQGRPVVFLGDGVPVFREFIREHCKAPYSYAPAHMNKQRGASVASLAAVYFQEGKFQTAAQHRPDYLRLSQAERERLETLNVRRMREEDIPAVAAIERTLFSRPWTEQSFAGALRQDTIFLVSLKGDEVIGYCGMYCSPEEGEITNVAVKPEEQGHGVGRKLVERLLEQARGEGMDRIVLEARISNENAIRLYEKLGFRSCGIRRNFYEAPREDGIVMALETG